MDPSLPCCPSFSTQPPQAEPLFATRLLGQQSDLELLSLQLGGEPARRHQRAQALLAEAGNLHALSRWSRPALLAAGVSCAEAERLHSLLEVGRRILTRPVRHGVVRSAQDAYAYLTATLGGTPLERFVVLVLDAQHRPLEVVVVAEGGVDACPVDPRRIFAAALVRHASALLVAHNHPSGMLAPSAADVALTRRLLAGAEVLGLPLLDHLIVGHPDDTPPYVSMAELKLLPFGAGERVSVGVDCAR